MIIREIVSWSSKRVKPGRAVLTVDAARWNATAKELGGRLRVVEVCQLAG
ncbi:hypothetical protein [Nonomuraea ferruginea]|uniref:Uncharacterized protein n=1 Tax=Nonomuraea ferruginea TaxID=46174 RepID=A0ABT4SSE5_9ACTN|nr:hypothetical protein [Nonomuraea ferruginea]MDA0640182.1 hypothetical protein [Nonomuraea ferruginea]